MDAKAAFLSALNGGLLAFLWGNIKIADWCGFEKSLGVGSSFIALLGLLCALWAISPREKLSLLIGRASRWDANYKPVSFYAYIAKNYKKGDFKAMETDIAKMGDAEFAHEALEQHFNISHIIQAKSGWIFRTVMLTLLAIALTGAALLARTIG
ncbi:hypothetical protein ACO0LM_00810 [Undibacterium sp. Di26W]|uniref:hypothetical protein n=1 Tax=Undibacterium sp. Di26W TaxID=3413035 RepID=UPI003BF220E1